MRLLIIILICVVAVLGIIDIKKKNVSAFALLSLLVFCVLWNIISGEMTALNMLMGAFPAGILLLISRVSRFKIGMGDIILIAIIGTATGADNVCLTLVIASVSCAAFSGALLFFGRTKKENTVAFIPFIGAGLLVSTILQGVYK